MSTVKFAFLDDPIQATPWLVPKRHYLIAEIGINHNGSLDLAKQLITICKAVGYDAVKFQKRTIKDVYSPELLNSYRESPWGLTLRDQKEGLELTLDEYHSIDSFCKSLQIDWFVSCWDTNSQQLMRAFNTPYNKIASAMGTNLDFVQTIADEGKPTFASTGMMTLDDIDPIVSIFDQYSVPLILMHTVSTYPASNDDLNLLCIKTLRDRYGLPVGYSGHESSYQPTIIAACLGACVIERHVTIDNTMYGSDQSASLDASQSLAMINHIRQIPQTIGNGQKKFIQAEVEVARKLRYWQKAQ